MPDLSSMAANVGRLLKDRGDTIAVSESSCGGLISASLVAVPGASAYYLGARSFTPAPPKKDSWTSPMRLWRT